MKKIARISIYFLTLCMAFSYASFAMSKKIPSNEMPMYGGIPRTSDEKGADDKLIQSTISEYGSREAAFQRAFEFGWNYFYRENYAAAMKRFNQSWLIDPNDSRIFNAFGMVVAAQSNQAAAIPWFQKGADKGDPKAQFNLGNVYFNGNGTKRNYVEAAKWFRLSAGQGLEWAQNMMGFCYEYGMGVPRNLAEAGQWYAKADANGATEKEKSWRHHVDNTLPPEGEMIKEQINKDMEFR